MKVTHLAAFAALTAPVLCFGQSRTPPNMEAQTRALAEESDLMNQCELSRKAGRLEQAEQQCNAAIQIAHSMGWPAMGYTATLGMIYYEQGQKRLGFETLRDSWPGYHGSEEAELYLGRIAIEMREYKTALEVVQRFRLEEGSAGSLPNGTREFWPRGDDVATLQATVDFLEGERLCQTKETSAKGIKLLRHADKLCPKNVAICYALGRELQRTEVGLGPAPFYKVVSEKGTGGVKLVADRWLGGHADALREAEHGKGR